MSEQKSVVGVLIHETLTFDGSKVATRRSLAIPSLANRRFSLSEDGKGLVSTPLTPDSPHGIETGIDDGREHCFTAYTRPEARQALLEESMVEALRAYAETKTPLPAERLEQLRGLLQS